jgi:hypothetical protein
VEEFNRWAVERNRPETTLNELMQTEGGRTLWKKEGFSWIGEFLFEEGNSCYAYLNPYLDVVMNYIPS